MDNDKPDLITELLKDPVYKKRFDYMIEQDKLSMERTRLFERLFLDQPQKQKKHHTKTLARKNKRQRGQR